MTEQDLKEQAEKERKRKITCNGKYKYIEDLKEEPKDYFNPYFDLYGAYLNSKNQNIISLLGNDTPDNDYFVVPGINVLAGITGHGKSMIANSIAYRAVKDGKNVLYITLEIPKKNLLYQMLSIYSHAEKGESNWISHSNIKKHSLNVKEEELVFKNYWDEFNNLSGNLYILDDADFDSGNPVSLQEQLCLIEEYSQKNTNHGIDLIIVDYIQLFKSIGERCLSEYQVLDIWSNIFRRISNNYLGLNHEIPILLISQLNRDAMNMEHSKRKYENTHNTIRNPITLSLSQMAGSIEMVKAASTVYAIYTDESNKVSSQCLIYQLKNRDGACHEDPLPCYMNPKYCAVGAFHHFDASYFGSYKDAALNIEVIPDISDLGIFNSDITTVEMGQVL